MRNVLTKYGIEETLTKDRQLALLEKEKLKLLRKLNHVFGNPEKEKELNAELENLEQTMAELEGTGGKFSLEDILVEGRGIEENSFAEEKSEAEIIRIKERLIKSDQEYSEDKIAALYDVVTYYITNGEYVKYEYWLLYGAQMGLSYFMKQLSDFYRKDTFGAEDKKKAFYWAKKAADLGEKDCCEEMGIYYADSEAEDYDPLKSAMYFVKAADSEHERSYIFAFQMFHRLGDYQKAETCLKAADQMGIQSAAHWFGVIYENGENSAGKKDTRLAQRWYEKEYQRYPNERIYNDLMRIYLENGEEEKMF